MKKRRPVTDAAEGVRRWLDSRGRLHRCDGPALERADGGKEWFKHGRRHRLRGPSIENDQGTAWYLAGELHRDDGLPALEYRAMTAWHVKGRLLRIGNAPQIRLNLSEVMGLELPLVFEIRVEPSRIEDKDA